MDAVREIVERLLRDSNALAVRLESPKLEVTSGDARLLPSVDDLKRRVEDRELVTSATSPAQTSLHLSTLSKDTLLLVVFDFRTSLGLVRLRVKKATEDLQRALTTTEGGSTPAAAAPAASALKAES